MANPKDVQIIRDELEAGIQLPKCQKCGCMQETLNALGTLLPKVATVEAQALSHAVVGWSEQMQPIRYACLGCEHCYPAVAQNTITFAFPELEQLPVLACNFQLQEEGWPPVIGEYFVVDSTAAVAVSTLASVQLAEELAARRPHGLAIVGKTETENIGIDKIIKNVITSPTLQYLLVAGTEPAGHFAGRTLLALAANGVDEKGRVIGSPGKRPLLRNVSALEIEMFRQQVQVIDLIGCESPDEISMRVTELAQQTGSSCHCGGCSPKASAPVSTVPKLVAAQPDKPVKMDKAGYFVIVPLAATKVINVEYYAYDNRLLHIIEGTQARAIYHTMINNGWVTELSHAAYLGKELAKAELSLEYGFKYVQDGA